MRLAALALPLLTALAAKAAPAPGPTDPLVAVLELRNKLHQADADVDAAYLTDRVRAEVLESKAPVRVMTRENLNALVQSQGRSLADCEGQCEVETARLIGADSVISGEVLRVGTALKLSLRLHDTSSTQLLAAKQVSGKDFEELDSRIGPVVAELVAPLRGASKSMTLTPAAAPPAAAREFASGPAVRMVRVPARGAPKTALALGLASAAAAAVGLKLQGETPVCRNGASVEQHPGVCTPADPNVWNTGVRADWASGPGPKLLGAGAVAAVGCAIWFVWSHGESLEPEPVYNTARSLQLEPAALALRF